MNRSSLRGERGAAMVEFALLATILVPTMLYGIFLFEASRAKIKINEASRYLIWEMTVVGLSDFQTANHQSKFDGQRSLIMSEVQSRYGDDLEGASPDFTGGKKTWTGITIKATFDAAQTTLINQEAKAYPISVVDTALGWFKFNTAGKVEGTFAAKVDNIFLGNTMPIGNTAQMLLQNQITISSTQSLIADQWDVKNGGAVNQVAKDGGCTSDFCKQVERTSFLNLSSVIPGGVTSAISGTLGFLGVHWPLDAVLDSNPMAKPSPGPDRTMDVPTPDKTGGHQPVTSDYTNVRTDFRSGQEKKSPYYKVWTRLGNNYMGCDQPERQEGLTPPTTQPCPYKAK